MSYSMTNISTAIIIITITVIIITDVILAYIQVCIKVFVVGYCCNICHPQRSRINVYRNTSV